MHVIIHYSVNDIIFWHVKILYDIVITTGTKNTNVKLIRIETLLIFD